MLEKYMTEEMEQQSYSTIRLKKTVILTRQFRLPTYLNGNKTGMMIEVCAGLLDKDHPEQCIIRETEEETGYRLSTVHKVFETYIRSNALKVEQR